MKLWRVVQVASRLEHSLKLDQMTPRGSKATIAFDYLEEAFGAGNAFPYTLVIESPEGARATIHLSDENDGALVAARSDDCFVDNNMHNAMDR